MIPFLLATLVTLTPFKPTLTLTPRKVTVNRGGVVAFSASINYEPNGPRFPRQPVKWTVEEGPLGGSITHAGVYTAPEIPGTYHVKAEREDFPGVSARAKVKVR